VLQQRDASLQGFRSRQVSRTMMEQANVVLCMTQGHRDVLVEDFPEFADKCYLLGDFSTKRPGENVPDPFGMGRQAYEQVAETIEEAMPGLLGFVRALPPLGDAQ
jgi:protein-tyrosine phosphatase